MLMMERVAGQYVPIITCDWCERRIAATDEANYEYEVAEDGRPIPGRLVYTHAGCCQAFEEAHGGSGHWRMDDLACLLVQIGAGLGLDWAAATARCQVGHQPEPH
jgi:hypothetical protein